MREKNKVAPTASHTHHQKKEEIKTEEPLTVACLLLPTSNLLVSSFHRLFTITANICKAQISNIKSDLRSQEAKQQDLHYLQTHTHTHQSTEIIQEFKG